MGTKREIHDASMEHIFVMIIEYMRSQDFPTLNLSAPFDLSKDRTDMMIFHTLITEALKHEA